MNQRDTPASERRTPEVVAHCDRCGGDITTTTMNVAVGSLICGDCDTPASESLKEVDDACMESFKNLPSELTPSENAPKFAWCCRRCSAHVQTDGNGVPQCGTCGSDMVRYVLDTPASEPPPDHEDFLAARKEGFKAIRKGLDKRRKASEPTPSEDMEQRMEMLEKHMVTVLAALIEMGVDIR